MANFLSAATASSSAEQQRMAELNKMVQEMEIEMMTDMYRRLSKSCQQKCISAHYREPDLTKGLQLPCIVSDL